MSKTKQNAFMVDRFLYIAVIVVVFAGSALAQNAADGFHGDVNGSVYRVRAHFDKTYIAGQQFTTVNGVARFGLARLNHDGSLDTAYNPNPNGALQGMEFDGTKLIVAGSFSSIGGGASGGIARLNFNGTNDGTFTAAISSVAAIAVQNDGKVLAGGHFTTVGGVAHNRLVRFNANGSIDSSFNPDFDSAVFGITVQPNGKILVSGQFNNVNGQPRWNFARLNADGTLDNSFFVNAAFPGANGTTYESLLQSDGKIIVAGAFSSFGGGSVAHNFLARLNPNGTTDHSFAPNFNGNAYTLSVLPDDKILVGGAFTTLNGANRPFIVRLNKNGTPDTNFGAFPDAQLNDIFVTLEGNVLISGSFTAINGIPSVNRVARLYPDGRLNSDTNVAVNNAPPYDMISLPGGQTLIAGGFTSVGGATREGMARIGWNGANDSVFANPKLIGNAYALAVQSDGKYLVGGDFSSAGGTAQGRIARFSNTGTLDGTFVPNFTNGASSAWVGAVSIQTDGKILAAGQFNAVNGTSRTNIVRMNSVGQVDTSFNANVDFYISNIAIQQDGKILIGGAFENVGGVAHAGIARLNADGSLDTTFNPILGGIIREVSEIKIDRNGKILVGGNFTGMNGNNRPNLARLNADGTLDTTFNADAIDGSVLNIVQDCNDYIYISGRFLNVGGFPHAYVAMMNSNGSVNSLFQNTAPNDNIQSMTMREDGKILVGGWFTTIGGQGRARFAALQRNSGPPVVPFTATPSSIQWYRDGVAPEVSRVVFEYSSDGVNYTFLGNGAASGGPAYYSWNLAMPPGTPSSYIRARGYNDFSDRHSAYEAVVYYSAPQPRRSKFDFDGDGRTDVSIFRPSVGQWWYLRSSDSQNRAFTFGVSTDVITPHDFTGDGKTDVAFFRPSLGRWYVLRSEDSSFYEFPFGAQGDLPAPADYDGDSIADAAVFRPSNGTWYILRSSGGVAFDTFGMSGDIPVPSDYDGDGKADVSIFRPSVGQWWRRRSSDGIVAAATFGTSTDKVVHGDYTGDGKSDAAFFRPSTGEWFINRSENLSSFYGFPFGTTGDIPAPGDYDGDGIIDPAVFRPSTGVWYILKSTSGVSAVSYGAATDRPVPNAYVN